jgi:hypothetical protein
MEFPTDPSTSSYDIFKNLAHRVQDDIYKGIHYSFSGVASEELSSARDLLLSKTQPTRRNGLPMKAVKWFARAAVRTVAEIGYGFFAFTSAIETLFRGFLLLLAQTARLLPNPLKDLILEWAQDGALTSLQSTVNNLLNLYDNLVDHEGCDDDQPYLSRRHTLNCLSGHIVFENQSRFIS